MSRHKLYYFEGRNTGVVARTAKEARERKKRGGNKIVAVREMTDEEREKGLQGEWIRTRRDGKQPGESRYGKGRGQGPPRGTNMAKRKKAKKKAVSKKIAAKRRVSKKTPVRRATKKTAVRRIAKKVTTTRARNPAPQLYWLQIGQQYFNGAGMTREARKASYFKDRKTAVTVAGRLARQTGKDVAVHTNRAVKKK